MKHQPVLFFKITAAIFGLLLFIGLYMGGINWVCNTVQAAYGVMTASIVGFLFLSVLVAGFVYSVWYWLETY